LAITNPRVNELAHFLLAILCVELVDIINLAITIIHEAARSAFAILETVEAAKVVTQLVYEPPPVLTPVYQVDASVEAHGVADTIVVEIVANPCHAQQWIRAACEDVRSSVEGLVFLKC